MRYALIGLLAPVCACGDQTPSASPAKKEAPAGKSAPQSVLPSDPYERAQFCDLLLKAPMLKLMYGSAGEQARIEAARLAAGRGQGPAKVANDLSPTSRKLLASFDSDGNGRIGPDSREIADEVGPGEVDPQTEIPLDLVMNPEIMSAFRATGACNDIYGAHPPKDVAP
ncbi:MAG TPA: hypothetical protein VFZ91_16400 [Allosphingosinicella sp.]